MTLKRQKYKRGHSRFKVTMFKHTFDRLIVLYKAPPNAMYKR